MKVIENIQFLCNTFLKTEREIRYTALKAYNLKRYQCHAVFNIEKIFDICHKEVKQVVHIGILCKHV